MATLSVESTAHGQASPEDIASARVLGTEGVRLADSGECGAAIAKLEAAERLYHAPTTLERLGECQVNLGRLVAGTESLNRVVRETMPANAPAAFLAAQQRAQQVLATAQPRIGKLRIHVEGAPLDMVMVTVDGAKVPSALFDVDRATDPGPHEVRASAAGYRTAVASIQLAAGAETPIALKLEPDENAQAGAPEPSGQGAIAAISAPVGGDTTAASSRSTGPNRVPAFLALGVGAVGVAVGSVFGIMALGTKSTLDSVCVDKKCGSPSSQSDIDALQTRALISNIGFGVGLVGVATGVVLMIASRGGEGPQRAAAAPPPKRVGLSPWIDVHAVGLRGIFE
jgi:hypothetical protein